ncbi:MAG: OsmC family protein, partial [Pseudomonadota bacterium]
HFHVTGQDLNEKRVARAIQLSAEQYCSASIMLEKAGVEITHDHTIYEE